MAPKKTCRNRNTRTGKFQKTNTKRTARSCFVGSGGRPAGRKAAAVVKGRRNRLTLDAVIKRLDDTGTKWAGNSAGTALVIFAGRVPVGQIELRGGQWSIVYRSDSGQKMRYPFKTLRALEEWIAGETQSPVAKGRAASKGRRAVAADAWVGWKRTKDPTGGSMYEAQTKYGLLSVLKMKGGWAAFRHGNKGLDSGKLIKAGRGFAWTLGHDGASRFPTATAAKQAAAKTAWKETGHVGQRAKKGRRADSRMKLNWESLRPRRGDKRRRYFAAERYGYGTLYAEPVPGGDWKLIWTPGHPDHTRGAASRMLARYPTLAKAKAAAQAHDWNQRPTRSR